MPYYIFQSKDGTVKEIFQHMNDNHSYQENEEDWVRIFTNPSAAIDTKINAFSSQDFSEKTKNKKGMTMGEAFDESRRLSEERIRITGKDEIKEKTIKDYETKCKGKVHPSKMGKDISI